jgi:hypothetical protein
MSLRPWLATSALTIAAVFGPANQALAQGHTPDPYNIVGEYNRQYEPYMYATVPTMPGTLPNQERLDPRSGLSGANRFQSYLENDDESDDFRRTGSSRLSGPGVPYYRANRQFDKEFQRNYRPNDVADRSYYTSQQQRNDMYFQALREPDPRKRAQLFREYNTEAMKASRSLSTARNSLEKDRDLTRDRFSTGVAPYEDEVPRSPSSTRPAAPRLTPAGRTPPRSAPPPPGAPVSRGSTAPPTSHAPARAATRGAAARPAPPSSSSGRTGASAPAPPPGNPSVSDLLDRSDQMERARRSTAPSVPMPAPVSESTAPAPPR